ncbi:MAG: nickel-dependent lactate racemase [candidate division KSB1 bacterium]|nr:nickel-dependent lactate racemase [candidate division KSB1 bacterium]MDZ7294450.1 nickel-dependent lactate racemase [candidate division KSB1 bacterium]
MELHLPYGRSVFTVELPGERVLSVVGIGGEPLFSEEQILRQALARPIGSPPLSRLVRRGERTTIVVPDASRRCAAQIFLPHLLEILNGKGIQDADITVLFATGSHGRQREEDRLEVVGPEVSRRVRLVDHDCREQADLVHVGETIKGTPVWFHKLVVKAERLIVAGGTSHHPITGYAGGPKLLNPGCVALETVHRCHALGIDQEAGGLVSECAPGVAEGNPVYDDIMDSMKFVQVDFALHVIVDARGRVREACAGALAASWTKARQLADAFYRVPVEQRLPLVVASCGGSPFDDTFVQAYRAIRNASSLVSDGGHLVLFAACPRGVGAEHFLEFFAAPSQRELARQLGATYRSFGVTALGLRGVLQRIRLTVVGGLSVSAGAAMGVDVEPSPERALEQALSQLPPGGQLAVVPNAHLTVPVVEGR